MPSALQLLRVATMAGLMVFVALICVFTGDHLLSCGIAEQARRQNGAAASGLRNRTMCVAEFWRLRWGKLEDRKPHIPVSTQGSLKLDSRSGLLAGEFGELALAAAPPPSQAFLPSGLREEPSHLQRRDRSGFTPDSLLPGKGNPRSRIECKSSGESRRSAVTEITKDVDYAGCQCLRFCPPFVVKLFIPKAPILPRFSMFLHSDGST
jgi:hypothetical protein